MNSNSKMSCPLLKKNCILNLRLRAVGIELGFIWHSISEL